MRKRLQADYVMGNYIYIIGSTRLSAQQVAEFKYLYDEEGYSYEIVQPSIEYLPINATRIRTPFGIVEVKKYHTLYIELPDKPTLESVATEWAPYFMEDDDSVHMTMAEHKRFAEECAEAGITALDVYNYLGI